MTPDRLLSAPTLDVDHAIIRIKISIIRANKIDALLNLIENGFVKAQLFDELGIGRPGLRSFIADWRTTQLPIISCFKSKRRMKPALQIICLLFLLKNCSTMTISISKIESCTFLSTKECDFMALSWTLVDQAC
ncbi:MAG: hypothetical protein ACRBM6_31250 [Geminicoccales bacterium]